MRYYWVMFVNGDFNQAVLDLVAERQVRAIWGCITLIFTEPVNIVTAIGLLLLNIGKYLWYNVYYLWRIVDATFLFTEQGVLYGFAVLFFYLEFFANDYEGFVALLQDNIWGISMAILFWPIYVAWIFFKWLFGI